MRYYRFTAIMLTFIMISCLCPSVNADAVAAPGGDSLVKRSETEADTAESEVITDSPEEYPNQIVKDLVTALWASYGSDGSVTLLDFYSDGMGKGVTLPPNSTETTLPEGFIWVLSGNAVIVQCDEIYEYEFNKENGNPSLLEYDDSGKVIGIFLPQGPEEEKAWTEMVEDAEDPISISFKLQDGTEILNQDNVASASLKSSADTVTGRQEYLIELTFDEEGKEAFNKATAEHAGEHIDIVVNGETVSSPLVQEPITDGKVVIAGLTQEEAEKLAEKFEK